MSVSDTEVAAEYRKRNEKVKLDVVLITPDAFKTQVNVTDTEVAAAFEKSKDRYRIGEKRKIKYALLDVDQVRQAIVVPRPTSMRSTSRTCRSTRRRRRSARATFCSSWKARTRRPCKPRPKKC